MKTIFILTMTLCISFYSLKAQVKSSHSARVPIVLDHNRMLVDAEMQRGDGTWRKVRLWVDSGNPVLTMNEALARDLGFDLSAAGDPSFKSARLPVPGPKGLRMGSLNLNLEGVPAVVAFQPFWLFTTMGVDGNLPSSLLRKYQVVFDYPKGEMSLALPGSLTPKGIGVPVNIHPETGIARVEAFIDKEPVGLALDIGASYSLIAEEEVLKYTARHPEWPKVTGTLGHANLWGWWPPNEQAFPVVRAPEIKLGNGVVLRGVGLVGVQKFANGMSWGDWYSQKTAGPVIGLLGPNALKAYRVEIDYAGQRAYFEKGSEPDESEMDIVGISVRQMADGTLQVAGIVHCEGKPAVAGLKPDDLIVRIDGVPTQGKTMGTAVDMLRGRPGDKRTLDLIRDGRPIIVEVAVGHFLRLSNK